MARDTERERVIWSHGTPEDIENYLEYLRIEERLDVEARAEALRLCPECRSGEHRTPPHGSALCRCSDLRCNCIVVGQVVVEDLR